MEVDEKLFDSQPYLEEPLKAHVDITGVGYLGRSAKFVEQQYRARMHQIELALRYYGLTDLAGRSVLDIGSGIGIWLDFWHQHGAESVAGLDFTQFSINKLKEQFPDDLIVQADVSVVPLPLPESMRFDIIFAFDVFLHIVDADGFTRAIANLADHCAPGGWLIISDAFVQGKGYVPARSCAVNNKVRSFAEYHEALEAHGFVIDTIQPATVLLGNPVEAPNRLIFLALQASWKISGLWGRSNLLSSVLGPVAIKADQLACNLCSYVNAPGAKIIFARKQD